jgi:tetratricopeptide (TPR) repeat protein
MSVAPSVQVIRTGLAGRWQIPLFVVGLVLFTAIIERQIKGFAPVSFEEHLTRVAKMHEAHELTRSGVYLKDLLKNPHRRPQERAELFRLYGKTAYLAESSLLEHQRQNIAAIVSNYSTAITLHAELSPEDWLALGDAYRWARQWPESIAALRKALSHDLEQSDRVRRQIVEMESSLPHANAEAIRKDLDEILADEHSSPTNYLWALLQVQDQLLQGGLLDESEALVKSAHQRLAHTPQEQALAYCEALCLRARGQSEAAEALLREFREQLTQRNEYWARAGWLLGRIQQEDGRPQMALAFYDEVLSGFSNDALRSACALGRAESLAALGRFDSALSAFRELRRSPGETESSPSLDIKAIRMTLAAIAETLRQDDQISTAADYLTLALEWTPAQDAKQRSEYMARIADLTSALALKGKSPKLQADSVQSQALLLRAGELRVTAAGLEQDDDRKIKLLELAADDYDAAGRTTLLIRTLAELTARHTRHSGRPTAMFRLAQAYRSQERYAEAISTYDEIIALYPRMPDALRSMVPLADCLLHLGDDQQKRGVSILTGIVDGTSGEQVFTPKAAEYRQALFTLAEFLSHADEKRWPNHYELAISRLEDALEIYPDSPEAPKLNYLLADGYRGSAVLLRADAEKLTDVAGKQGAELESRNRLAKAAGLYERVIKLVADEDAAAVSGLQEVYLQSSYLARGDCYFELGELERALEAYREAAWRYENQPVALNACIQEYHCLQRLGRASEGQSGLSRLRWLLRKMPASAFDPTRGISSKSYWQGLIDRLEQTSVN